VDFCVPRAFFHGPLQTKRIFSKLVSDNFVRFLVSPTPDRGFLQEDQELSETAPARQLILTMNSEDQTVDHTNILMGNDHDTNLYVMSSGIQHKNTQTLKMVIKGPMTVYRHWIRHVHLCSHDKRGCRRILQVKVRVNGKPRCGVV
jgi:hypothetical protein